LLSSAFTHTYDSGSSAMHSPISPSCNSNIYLSFSRHQASFNVLAAL
jgi:hypothetical protein